MSLERRERRRCDKCGEIISGPYYSCEKKFHAAVDDYMAVSTSTYTGVIGAGVWQPPPTIDVCQDCWEKMDKK